MKKLQQLSASVVLIFVLSASTFAGDGVIWPWVISPTPTPTSASDTTGSTTTETDGIITTGFTSADSATEVVLSLLPSVLALL